MRRRERRGPRLRGIVAALLGAALVVTGVGVVAVTEQTAKAAVLDDFDAADVISNAVMYNTATMTAGDIQAFLNRMQPGCASGATCLKSVKVDMPRMAANPMCKAVAPRSKATAAQVIAAVGKACGVNPQVILVMLQKEQTLITGRKPYSGESVSLIYRKATGLGCPDTAACDPAKYGLFNQLYGVAYWLIRYTMPKGTGPGTAYASLYNWFPVGRANGVLYHPNATCGARTITIRNKATASLYYYTPYQPNAASLGAGWGLGNSCSSYGNRNFYLYFTTWFGSTHYSVTGPIKTFWSKNAAAFGDPIGNATAVKGGGSYQRFEKGVIGTTSAGTFGVRGAVLTKWTAMGGPTGALGLPRKTQTVRTGSKAGTIQAFTGGTVYVSKAGTAAVLAPVYAKYLAAGYELGVLGYPTGDARTSTAGGGATVQVFQGGRVVVASGRSSVVTGSVLAMWAKRDYEAGSLGWPTGDAKTITANGRTGLLQPFRNGVVTVQGTARTVTGSVGSNYVAHGGPTGYLGWPTTANAKQTAGGGGWLQRFEKGVIFSNAAAGVHGISSSATLRRYDALGGPSGPLGWLRSNTKVRGGKVAVFTTGRIYSRSAGTYSVTGGVLTAYLKKGAQAGVLGWPVAQPTTAKGTTVQRFQHGTITWSSKGGARITRT